MAGEVTDISELTEDQQSALQQYLAVTNQSLGEAVPLLKRCEWNVQVYDVADAASIMPLDADCC